MNHLTNLQCFSVFSIKLRKDHFWVDKYKVVDGLASQLTVVADTLEETDAQLAASPQG